MKKEDFRNMIWGLFFFFLAIFIWIIVPYQIPVPRKVYAMGPRFFPRFISLLLALVSLGLILQSLIKIRKEKKSLSDGEEKQNVKDLEYDKVKIKERFVDEFRAIGVIILMAIYTLFIPIIGFIIPSIVIGSIILFILSGKKWYYYVILIASVFLIYYIFKYHLYVQLP